jgi:hypothetical protein
LKPETELGLSVPKNDRQLDYPPDGGRESMQNHYIIRAYKYDYCDRYLEGNGPIAIIKF